jgi:hypothetical protein
VIRILSGLFVLLLLLLIPQPQPNPTVTEATQTDRRRSIMGAYWTIADGFQSTLMLTNTSNELLQIEPEVYNLQGQRFDLPEIKLRDHQRLILDVKQWLATGDVKTAQAQWPGPTADEPAQSEISKSAISTRRLHVRELDFETSRRDLRASGATDRHRPGPKSLVRFPRRAEFLQVRVTKARRAVVADGQSE